MNTLTSDRIMCPGEAYDMNVGTKSDQNLSFIMQEYLIITNDMSIHFMDLLTVRSNILKYLSDHERTDSVLLKYSYIIYKIMYFHAMDNIQVLIWTVFATSPGNAHDVITLLFRLCYTLQYYAIKSYFMRTKTQIIERKLIYFAYVSFLPEPVLHVMRT